MEHLWNKSEDSTLINFLEPELKPSISCSALGAEDYPIENLICSDVAKSNRGFIVYLSKPPVNVTIKLMCPIELRSIKIWPEIGSLKSTGFDISICNKYGNSEEIASCDDLNENCVVFCRLNDPEIPSSHVKKCFFFRNLRDNTKVDKLVIRIWKTKNSCVPAIKRIEIWGKPTGSADTALKQWQVKNMTFSVPEQQLKIPDCSSQTNEMEIPEELLDSITHQIMTVPMVLPSGKIVDQSTIEKFSNVEASWGREPSDPFTSLTFTVNRKPVFSPALKSTIDKFLNKYPENLEVRSVPRTIGTVTGNGKRIVSSTLVNSCESSKRPKYFGSDLNGIEVSASTKYLCRSTPKETNIINCCKCQSIKELYKIKTCDKHFICRSCLHNIQFNKFNGECSCNKHFSKNDVEKYHNSSNAFNYYLS